MRLVKPINGPRRLDVIGRPHWMFSRKKNLHQKIYSKLVQRENVIVTSHLVASTTEPQECVTVEIAEAVVGALKGKLAATAVIAPMVPEFMLSVTFFIYTFFSLSLRLTLLPKFKGHGTINDEGAMETKVVETVDHRTPAGEGQEPTTEKVGVVHLTRNKRDSGTGSGGSLASAVTAVTRTVKSAKDAIMGQGQDDPAGTTTTTTK